MIIVVGPFVDGATGMIEAKEQAFVQEFVTHAAVEGFDVTILHRFSGRNVVPFDLVIFRPGQDCVRRELRAVIGDDHAGLTASFDQHH